VKSKAGPRALRDLLRLDGGPSPVVRGGGAPTIRGLDAELDGSGAWHVRAEVRLPAGQDPWLLSPVAKFDVRSGARPSVGWSEVVAGQNCELVGDKLLFKAGARSASFSAVTDVSTHPVRAELAGLIVELQKARGASE
jgi:RNA polymerase primary sigma factor